MGYFKIKISVNQDDHDFVALLRRFSAVRKLSSTIRDALMLYDSLQRGETDVLLRLFPFLRAALAVPASPPAASGGGAKPLQATSTLPSPALADVDDLLEVKRAVDSEYKPTNLTNQLLAMCAPSAAAGGD